LIQEQLHFSPDASILKALQTIIGINLLWVIASLLKTAFFVHPKSEHIRSRTPRLLVDIVRFALITVGGVLIAAGIWKKDLTPLLTTFGVGSIVLGLALQDTLGNLFAGLSLIFEKPFSVGDWIQVGEVIGRVHQINWRATRITTRELNEVIVPNSVLTKERIINFYRPVRSHGVRINLGFAYDHPPNQVKDIVVQTLLVTPGVLHSPPPDVRTINFGAYAVDYEVLFFIGDYEDLTRIRNAFMTQVWYAARRNGLVFPYPTSTVFKTEVANADTEQKPAHDLFSVLRKIDLLHPLSDDEVRHVANGAITEVFARGEAVVHQGESGDSMFVVIAGTCAVLVQDGENHWVQVAALRPGDVFGEMSLLAGEVRTATVRAEGDLTVARIKKELMRSILESRSDLLERFSEIAARRLSGIESALLAAEQGRQQNSVTVDEKALLQRIRRFFGL